MTRSAAVKSQNPLRQILDHGQSIWYDGLVSKEEFKKMIERDGIRGATTNPTIFEKAVASGVYDSQITELEKSHSTEKIYQLLSVNAVQEVADVFLPVFQETAGQDGFVSIEVSPLLAHDTEQTIQEARELHRLVNRKNVMIKIPATKQGIPAIEVAVMEGININVTLIFSVQRYREVMEAYLLGLEKRFSQSKPINEIASVASFFVSRVDTATDRVIEEKLQLSKISSRSGALKNLLGKVAIANSKLAYKEFENVFSSFRFRRLKAKGAQIQRPLWASTGTKNPLYSDVLYVESLIGPSTVNTMPPATLEAFGHHGVAASRLTKGLQEASQVFKDLNLVGIDLAAVTDKLEQEGVKLFSDSYSKLIRDIQAKLGVSP